MLARIANRPRLVIALVFTALLVFAYYLWIFKTSAETLSSGREVLNISTAPAPAFQGPSVRPKILIWARLIHEFDWSFPVLPNGDGGCDITRDKSEIKEADAVAFYIKDMGNFPDPRTRRKNQVYTWWSHESPWTTRHFYGLPYEDSKYNNYFNWTMTYRLDDDVISAMWPTPAMDYLLMRIGRIEDMVDKDLAKRPRLSGRDFKRQVEALLSRKTKSTAWIVTDCDLLAGARKRKLLAESLEKEGGLPIGKFGKCANNPLPFNFTVVFQTLSPYKFYLAFENSYHCRDYLTEKTIFNSMVAGVVPVIYGPSKDDVEKIMPKKSYIYVDDFENVSELAKYLKHLDKTDAEYMEYFKWWQDPGAQTFPRFGFNYGPKYLKKNSKSETRLPAYTSLDLQDDWLEYERFGLYHLCRKLKRGDHLRTTKIIEKAAAAWYGDENPHCLQ